MLAAGEAVRQQSAVLHKMLLRIVRASTVCRRLLSVRNVGPVVALTYATSIDDPARFVRSRAVGPHSSPRASTLPGKSTATARSPRPATAPCAKHWYTPP
jgi:transposase